MANAAQLLPYGGAKRRPLPKAVQSAAPSDRPKTLSAEGAIDELARRLRITSQQEHGCSLHGKGKLGSTATTRRVKE